MGEGSFVGRYGYLPEISEGSSDDQEIAASIQFSTMKRHRGSARLSNLEPAQDSKFKVKVDIELTSETEDPTIDSQEEQSTNFSGDGTASTISEPKQKQQDPWLSSPPPKARKHSKQKNAWDIRVRSTSDDQVINEDGKPLILLVTHLWNLRLKENGVLPTLVKQK